MPSEKDVFKDDQCRIRIHRGRYFHMHRDDPNEVDIMAIASATSRLCRFTGHLKDGIEIYSVAEHSIYVSHILEMMGCPPSVCFQGLMHDASEAYLADIAAPFKGEVGNYYATEEKIMSRIKERFLLPETFDPRVGLADWYALFNEARQILFAIDEGELATWQGYERHGVDSEKFHLGVNCWLPSMARIQFLARFAELQDRMLETTDHG